ncbi:MULTISPECIES: helix-turn-helix domain-containing protein [unclassified Streptomyces]|uniref:AraC family transcriptional regulator n=1 Tax=unclassified Streptomyces TaxID=2593676 RepID=UPI00278C83C2|nr:MULTISPECIES: helix-turn-helix domain-containing protein [unclassified Streptomyces]
MSTGSHEFVRATPRPGGPIVSAVGYRTRGVPPALHRGLPSPYLTVIFTLDGPVVGGHTPEQATGPGATRTDVVVGGLHQRPAYIAQSGSEAGIQLAVHPLAARALLGVPAAALAGPVAIEGTDVLGRSAAHVREELAGLDDWRARFDLLAAYLTPDEDPLTGVRHEVAEAWTWLARHRGAGTLRGLAAHVALSERRLTTLFRAETGLAPKQAARLMRFQHAKAAVVRSVASGAPPDLARVAAEHGYCDHSHLVRDFHQYTGLSPTGWLAEECRNIQAGGHHNGED